MEENKVGSGVRGNAGVRDQILIFLNRMSIDLFRKSCHHRKKICYCKYKSKFQKKQSKFVASEKEYIYIYISHLVMSYSL